MPTKPATWTRVKGAKKVRGPEKKPARKYLRKASPKQAKRLREYHRRRKIWLAKPENKFCHVCLEFKTKLPFVRLTDDVHHKAGRRGSNLLDESTWLAVCRTHHDAIHTLPHFAVSNGYSVSRLSKP
jgi:hypothetical protein